MGTNYFLYSQKCPHCGIERKDKMHLGKSSAGWCFGLHVYPKLGLNGWHEMWEYICFCVSEEGYKIENEYGETVCLEDFRSVVLNRSSQTPFCWSWFHKNHPLPGPFGLARHPIDGEHCIGNAGPNTPIDYIIGEFS